MPRHKLKNVEIYRLRTVMYKKALYLIHYFYSSRRIKHREGFSTTEVNHGIYIEKPDGKIVDVERNPKLPKIVKDRVYA
jgi:hypothetical protein